MKNSGYFQRNMIEKGFWGNDEVLLILIVFLGEQEEKKGIIINVQIGLDQVIGQYGFKI